MKILVTGHSGLLGSNLVPLLEAHGHEVYGVSRTDRMGMGKNSFQIDLADLQLPSACEFVFQTVKPEIVFHLAACASEAKGQVSPMDMTRRNLVITTNVIRNAVNVGVKKIIYASSVSVYGDSPTPYLETATPKPKDVYGVNKLAGEQVLKIMSDVYGFDYTIFRPHNLYGPGQNPNDLTKNVVNLFMRRILEEKPYTIMGGGSVLRGFSYAGDVAQIFAKAVTEFSHLTMNVGTKQVHTIKELSDKLQAISGSTVPIEYQPLRKQEIDVFIADHKRQDQMTHYHETPLQEGLQKTWEWMKKQELGAVVEIPKEIYVQA